MNKLKTTSVCRSASIQGMLFLAMILTGSGAMFYLYLVRSGIVVPGMCDVYRLTGFYCPGCGGTRSLMCLLSGDIAGAVYWHPFVPYVCILCGVFFVRYTLHLCFPKRIGLPPLSDGWIKAGLMILLSQWMVKNILLVLGFAYLS